MKTMTTLLLTGAVASIVAMPARAFADEVAASAPAAAALAKAQDEHTAASNAVNPAIQAEVDAKAKVAELEKQTVTDENKAAHADLLKTAKAAVTAATKGVKDANSAVTKAGKAVDKAQKAATKESEAAAKAQAKATEDAEKVKAAEAAKQAAKQPEANGITRPKPDSMTGKAWAIFDDVSKKNGAPASIGETLPVATAQGINEATCRTQYARWRKFHGVSGRIEAPKAPEAPAAPAAPTPAEAPAVPPVPAA